MQLENEDTGLYFSIEDFEDLSANIPPLVEVSIDNPVVYSLGFGGYMAFETQGGLFMDADELLAAAKQLHQMVVEQ